MEDRVQDVRELGSSKLARAPARSWALGLVAGTGVPKSCRKALEECKLAKVLGGGDGTAIIQITATKSGGKVGVGRFVVFNPRKNNRLGQVGNCIGGRVQGGLVPLEQSGEFRLE